MFLHIYIYEIIVLLNTVHTSQPTCSGCPSVPFPGLPLSVQPTTVSVLLCPSLTLSPVNMAAGVGPALRHDETAGYTTQP